MPKQNYNPTNCWLNIVGNVGFSLSLIGLAGEFLVPLGPVMAVLGSYIAFLCCLPGLVVSIVGLFRAQPGLAGWGVALGVWGVLNLPTLYSFVLRPAFNI